MNINSLKSQEKFLIDSLYKIINSSQNDTTKIIAYCDLSKEYCGIDNDKAYILAKEALTQATKINNSKFIAQSFLRIGSTYDYKMMWDSALTYYIKSIHIYEDINDKSGIASCYQNIGVMYYYQNDFDKALEYYNNALNIRLALNEWKYVAKLYNNIGVIYRRQKKYADALFIYNKSLNLKRRLNDSKGISTAYMNIGMIYNYVGKYDSAIYYCQKSLDIDISRGDIHDIASNYQSLGKIYLDNKKFTEAKLYLNKSIDEALKINSNELLYNGYGYLSTCDTVLNDYKEAYAHNKKYDYYYNKVISEEKTLEIEKLQALYQSEKKDASIKILNGEKIAKEKEGKVLYSLLITITLLLTIIIVFYYRKRKDNQLLIQQKKEIIDKTETLKHQAAEIAMFKTQINPHFIFNAINAVQGFVIDNNKSDALEKLTDLSKLIRTTLNYSDKELIALKEECEFLKEYFKFEQLRCNIPISLNIHIASSIDASNVLIPPMIIQPFIENAVKHGLIPKKEAGNITIKIELDSNLKLLLINVIDDGIGIDFSNKNKSIKHYNSKGIDITINRIKSLFEKNNIHSVNYVIASEIRQNKIIKGTEIHITLPYLENF